MFSTSNDNYKFWRNGNHPEEIVTEQFFWQKLNYIHLNPVRQKIVAKASHYIYCSASNFINNSGIIEIEFINSPHQFVNSKHINYEIW